MQIRPARSDEAGPIAEVWLRSRHASVPAIPPPAHTDDEVRGYFRDVLLPTREAWVAESDDEVVALLVLDDDWVDQLYVDPRHTGQAIGTGLLEVAKAERPGGLRLWTFEANDGARRFYERHGFLAVAFTDGDNEEGAPDVLYVWSA